MNVAQIFITRVGIAEKVLKGQRVIIQ